MVLGRHQADTFAGLLSSIDPGIFEDTDLICLAQYLDRQVLLRDAPQFVFWKKFFPKRLLDNIWVTIDTVPVIVQQSFVWERDMSHTSRILVNMYSELRSQVGSQVLDDLSSGYRSGKIKLTTLRR